MKHGDRRHRPSYTELLDRVAMLEAKLARYEITTTGAKPRAALDIDLEELTAHNADLSSMALLGWDIDKMKDHNSRWGEPEVNRRLIEINGAIKTRGYDVYLVWSGDEHVLITDHQAAIPLAQRIQQEYEARGMSATFIITDPTDSPDLHKAIERQRELCTGHKNNNERHAIHDHRRES